MAVGHAHRRDRGVDDVGAGLDRLDQGCGGEPGGGVAVQAHRQVRGLLDLAHQFVGGIGLEQAGHVLDADGMAAHVLDALRHVDPGLQVVHRAEGVGEGALGMLAGGHGGAHRGFEVAHVVHGVEDAEHIDAVDRAALDEFLDHIVGVMAVAEAVLAAQQHLLRGFRHRRLELAQALPGVFAEIADAGVEGGAAPGFQRPVADVVELLGDRQHVVDAHARGEQGLMAVSQYDIGDLYGIAHGGWSAGRGIRTACGARRGWPRRSPR